MELDVMLYRMHMSATALFLSKMVCALSSCDVVTFLINTACILSYYFSPQNLNCCLRVEK